MTSSRTRVCHVQTYFQHHLARIRIINRSREKINQPKKKNKIRKGWRKRKKKDRDTEGREG